MKEPSPQVSVVIPAFNEGLFLTACLESLLTQSLEDWEAVVVDDGSPEVDIEALAGTFHDERVHVIRHGTNKGLGAARNTGFRAALAPLIVAVDSDDVLNPRFLEVLVTTFVDLPETDCVFTDFRLFGASDEVWRYDADRSVRDMLLRQWIPGPGTMMRRAVWEKAGGYCEERALLGNEDWDFWIAVLATDPRIVHVPQPLYLYRRHDASMSSGSLPYVEHLHREQLYDRHRALYDSYGLGGTFRAAGYLNSARFAWSLGQRRRALALLGRGVVVRGVTWPLLRSVTHGVGSTLWRRPLDRRSAQTP